MALDLSVSLQRTTLVTVREIVQSYQESLATCVAEPAAFNQGIWYANRFFELAQESPKFSRDRFSTIFRKAHFYNGLAPSSCFEMLPSRDSVTNSVPYFFLAKKNIVPSVALTAIKRGLSFLGGGEVCQIGMYEAIQNALGVHRFDVLFSQTEGARFSIGLRRTIRIQTQSGDTTGYCIDPLLPLTKVEPTSDDQVGPYQLGQVVFFRSIQEYSFKHLNGEGLGFFTVCCDAETPKFVGLGLSAEGNSQSEISTQLLAEYNKYPIDMEILPQKMGKMLRQKDSLRDVREEFRQKQLSAEEYQHMGGGEATFVIQMEADRIRQLSSGTDAEALELYRSWTKDCLSRVHFEVAIQ